MKTSENIDQIAAALALAQGEFLEASKDGESHHGKHATLTSIWKAVRVPLSKNGLAVIQAPYLLDGRVHIITQLTHKSGQWIETELSIKPARDDAQQIGSAITYGRRYSLAPMLGIVTDEDDDGNAASGKDNRNGASLPPVETTGHITFGESKKPLIQMTANGTPKKIFDRHNAAQTKWLFDLLAEKKLASDVHEAFFEDLDGKDILTELTPLLNKYLDGEE